MNRGGFTLIELLVVLALVGILAVAALPRFLSTAGKAEQAARDGVVGAIRSGIAIYRSNELVTIGGGGTYPAELDPVPDGSMCSAVNRCFTELIPSGIEDSSWTKINSSQYFFNDGTTVVIYTYDNTSGTFRE
jgi:prepilin-type N-terminal cleavage/methylation domain-containing protein